MCRKTRRNAVLVTCSLGLLAGCVVRHERSKGTPQEVETGAGPARAWKDSFGLEKCTLLSVGRNDYFILLPGYQLVLAKQGGGGTEEVFITVLDETENVDGVETRVVEEREFVDGKLKEVSRNFFTICREHSDVFYHGEDVDDYEKDKVVGHGGAWRAGVRGARAGLMMPGTIELGARFYQEVAPGVAMDRAEIVTNDMTVRAPAGIFTDCLKVVETSPLEPGSESLKVYAPGVGMVVDDDLALARYGRNRSPPAAPVETGAGATGASAEVETPAGETSAPVPAPKAPARIEATARKNRARPASTRPAAEVEIPSGKMPAPVAAVIAKLYPEGRIHEVKRETHPGGRVVYAVEIFVGDRQYDVEATEDGTVLRNEAE